MALANVTLKSLHEIDGGKVGAAFEHELGVAVRDCLDRPGEKKARTVTIQLQITPEMDVTGETTHCEIGCHVWSDVPKRKTRRYQFLTGRNGKLIYSEHNPVAVDQTTIFDADAEGSVKLDKPAGADDPPPKPAA